jgi:isoquinoline 1-oxidoreductase beta subunit
MTASRRDFIKVTALAGTSLMLGVATTPKKAEKKPFKPNAWLRIDPDGKVTITVGKSEMGQGVRTSLPMIVAEELDADWEHVAIEQAMPGPDFQRLGTGGSWSIGGSWKPLRTAGATARAMLVVAAAARWSADAKTLRTEKGFVIDAAGRRASYGDLATAAAALPVPKDVPLKKREDFRILGRPTKRLDGPDIVHGKAKYGIDTRVPGMLFATIERGPFSSIDATKVPSVPGADVVMIPTGAAVVAPNTWAALKARSLLTFTRNDSQFDSDAWITEATAALKQDGVSMRREGTPPEGGKTIEATYVYPFYAHAPVETMNCIADVREKSATIWTPTQTPNEIQDLVAEQLGFPKSAVEVHVTLMGGGFGRRLRADYAVEAAQLSRAIHKPVQVLWTRTDDMRDGHLQHASVHGMRATLGDDGRILGWQHKKASRALMTGREFSADDRKDMGATLSGHAWGSYDIPYAIPSLDVSYVNVDSPSATAPGGRSSRRRASSPASRSSTSWLTPWARIRCSSASTSWRATDSRSAISSTTAAVFAARWRSCATAAAGARPSPPAAPAAWR